MPQNPPHVNGVMELTETEVSALKVKLDAVIAAFAPTDDQPVCDTFYIVSTYNKSNKGKEINGDTAQYVMSYTPSVGE